MIKKIFAVLLLLSSAACNSQNNTTPMLIDNLTKAERDPSMMFYLEQAYQGKDVSEMLASTEEAMIEFINAIPEEKMSYRYGFGKWTVAEVLQHIISYEEIMLESALKIASKEVENPLGYYNQSTTANAGKGATKQEMLDRFKKVRKQTMKTFAAFSEEELLIMGVHEWFAASPRTMALCISGHQAHHFGVIRDKYLD